MLIKRGKKETKQRTDPDLRAKKLLRELKIYQEAKKKQDREAITNEKRFESKHWQYIKGKQKATEISDRQGENVR